MLAPRAFLGLPLLLGSCAFAVLSAPVARAHGIQTTLERLGSLTSRSPYQLESRFSSGLPARDAAVRMVSPDGATAVELGHTNGEGQLTFQLPSQARADWEVQIDAGPGHRDYVELPGVTPSPLRSQGFHALEPLARGVRPLGVRPLGALLLLGAMAGVLLHRPRR